MLGGLSIWGVLQRYSNNARRRRSRASSAGGSFRSQQSSCSPDVRFDLQRRRRGNLVGNYASPRQASATIARTATCTDPPFGAVFQTAPTPSHTIVAVLRRRLTLRSRAKAAPRSNLHCKGRMYPQQQRAAGATLGYPSHKIAPLASSYEGSRTAPPLPRRRRSAAEVRAERTETLRQ